MKLGLIALAISMGLGAGIAKAEDDGDDADENLEAPHGVVVNGVPLSAETLASIAKKYRVKPAPGRYWYDSRCGAWGFEGTGTIGFLRPGLRLGGKLRADASRGTTGVYINGRQITLQELLYLHRLTPVAPGRYWLDGRGYAGRQGGPALVNLVALSRRAGGGGARGGGGGGTWRSKWSGIGVSSGGGTVGIIGKGWSVITGP